MTQWRSADFYRHPVLGGSGGRSIGKLCVRVTQTTHYLFSSQSFCPVDHAWLLQRLHFCCLSPIHKSSGSYYWTSVAQWGFLALLEKEMGMIFHAAMIPGESLWHLTAGQWGGVVEADRYEESCLANVGSILANGSLIQSWDYWASW